MTAYGEREIREWGVDTLEAERIFFNLYNDIVQEIDDQPKPPDMTKDQRIQQAEAYLQDYERSLMAVLDEGWAADDLFLRRRVYEQEVRWNYARAGYLAAFLGESISKHLNIDDSLDRLAQLLDEGRQSLQTGLETFPGDQRPLNDFIQRLNQSAPNGIIPVVVEAGLAEQYPELKTLAGLEGSPVLLSQGDLAEDVMALLSKWWDAIQVIFVGSEAAGIRSTSSRRT